MVAADRDLLFGLLALQNGLIDQVQLVAAFHAWIRDKARPLADHLVARGDLDAEQRDGVEAMVALHLKKHGGDSVQSLMAIPVGRSTREGLAKIGDPEIDATLTHFGSGSTEKGDVEPTATYVAGQATFAGSRFRILRPHAAGGLGKISVALDGELHRQVAVKEIREHFADDPHSRARFVQEAEITGGLEHPGIVPVYSLGYHDDGKPFYAMRLVKGESLRETIANLHSSAEHPHRDPVEQSMSLRRLLGRFLDVCNTVAYAHSRGVLHRDLKPGNILVGPYGETLVVDWGVAKVAGRDKLGRSAAGDAEPTLHPDSRGEMQGTLPGSQLGTPGYMSPEQAAGEHGQLGPQSDVYSLGAILYQILTGRQAFPDDDVASRLRKTQKGEFPPPRSIKPTVPRALEAICLKAMALRPEDRYQSPRELSGNIEHWLADEPVPGYREPILTRLARWARRHKPHTAGAAALLISAVIGLAAGAFLLGREQRRTDAARLQAESNFRLALDAVGDYFDRVNGDPFLKEPGMDRLRRELLQTASDFYGKVVTRGSPDRYLRARLATANHRLGEVTSSIGSTARAIDHMEKALTMYEALSREEPKSVDYRRKRAECLELLSDLYNGMGQLDRARTAILDALRLLEGMAREYPDHLEIQDSLAGSFRQAGYLANNAGMPEQAESYFLRSLEITEKIIQRDPDSGYLMNLTHTQAALANTIAYHLPARDSVRAEQMFRPVLAIRKQLVEADPGETDFQISYAWALGDVAALHELAGRRDEGRKMREQALAIWERLVSDHPDVVEYQSNVTETLEHLGRGSNDPASVQLRAIATWTKQVRAHPHVASNRENLALAHVRLGLVRFAEGRHAEAGVNFNQGVAIWEKVVADHPDRPDYREMFAEALDYAGQNDMALGQLDRAKIAFNRMVQLTEQNLRDDPNSITYRRRLVSARNNQGLQHRASGDLVRAQEMFERASAELDRLVEAVPLDLGIREAIGGVKSNIGMVLSDRGEKARALELLAKAIETLDDVLRNAPGQRYARAWLRDAHMRRAGVLAALHRDPEAVVDWDRAMDLAEGQNKDPLRLDRALALARAGDFSRALAEADSLSTSGPLSPDRCFRLAQVYARASADPRGEGRVAADRAAARAVAMLQRAREAGDFLEPARRKLLKENPEFQPVRNRPEFRSFLEDLDFPADPFAY